MTQHSHKHSHRVMHPHAFGFDVTVEHEHEHRHTGHRDGSFGPDAEGFMPDFAYPHRMHRHTKEQEADIDRQRRR